MIWILRANTPENLAHICARKALPLGRFSPALPRACLYRTVTPPAPRATLAEALKRVVGNAGVFDGVHIFTSYGDVPDDSALRMVILPPWQETQNAFDAVLECIRNNGNKPRYRSNRLIFLAADQSTLSRLRDAARVVLAWTSIVDDVEEGRLNVDLLQKKAGRERAENR